MPLKINLINKKFGSLTVISEHLIRANDGKVKWECICLCGNKIVTSGANLRSGDTKSCGCLPNKGTTTHGLSSTIEYHIWKGIKQRCYNKKAQHYIDYGGRGIIVCDRWLNSFECFLEDMGKIPTQKHSIDRIDNNGNYEPNNCKWSTKKEQGKNKRNNRLIEHSGIILHLQGWAEFLKIPVSTLHSALKNKSFDLVYNKYVNNC